MPKTIQFILTPDASSARRLRRLLAEQSAFLGVVAGTWGELLQYALRAYNVPLPGDVWQETLAAALPEVATPFWNKSLEVAPDEVTDCLDATFAMLLEATTGAELPEDMAGVLSERGRRHLHDLVRLHHAIGLLLPAEMEAIQRLLLADSGQASFWLKLYCQPDWPRLGPRLQLLVDKLAADFGTGDDPVFIEMLAAVSTPDCSSCSGSLGYLQQHLFREHAGVTGLDGSLQWLLVRDHLEEVEVVAGMIQTAMAEDSSLNFADFALLLPDHSTYPSTLRAVFTAAGIPLAGLPATEPVRDVGYEAVHAFLLAMRQPAPCMAVASLLASPLMPWDAAYGARIAQSFMDGDGLPENSPLTLLVLDTPVIPEELARRLRKFLALISAGHGPERHLARARGLVATLLEAVATEDVINWKTLERLVAPQLLSNDAETAYSREGVAVFQERQEPWRICRTLFVLGFSSGRYPGLPLFSPVFSQDDLQILNNKLGYKIELHQELSLRRRELFRRQLGAARNEITFLVPRRDGAGETLHPSESLTFMSQLFTGKREGLLLESEREDHRTMIRHLPCAEKMEAAEPRLLDMSDPQLGCNLLARRTGPEGEQKPESPSGLETLLVSPLMWLLHRYDLEPKEWAPDTLDVLTKGSLAHRVFEQLFAVGKPLPDSPAISSLAAEYLKRAIEEIFPLLATEEWRVERRHLERDIEKAAIVWGEMLQELQATVSGVEATLSGLLDTLPLSGKADLLLTLPGGRMLVVDYKKSGSRGRIERMKKGYDMQTSLYRIMLETGGVADDEALTETLKKIREIGVMYYLLNDQTAVTDSSGWTKGDIAGLHEMGDAISGGAMEMIRERIRQLESGRIALNTNADEEWFEKAAGIKPYAFDNSPLVRLFMK